MIKNNIFLFLSIVILGFACSDSGSENAEVPPVHMIPKEKMIIILADIQITEAYVDDLRKSGVQVRDTSLIYFEKVFKKHDITPAEFEGSLLFYQQNLVGMSEMYSDVITRLNELKAKNEEIILNMKRDSARMDSLQKLQTEIDSLGHSYDSIMISDTNSIKDSLSTNSENNIQL
jgi:hypothetical protein